jgi:hypothetical protein
MKFLTEETPVKVMGLLGTAMVSMFFLFAVSVSNANFSQTEKSIPVAFSPEQVVAVLDNTASSYDNFLNENLFQPAQNSYAVYQYNLAYVIDEASPSILAMMGLSGLVAGESTKVVYSNYYKSSDGGVFSLFFGN